MKTTKSSCLALFLISALGASADSPKPQTIKSFSTSDHTISKDVVVGEDKTWMVDCKKAQVVRFFEVPDPGVDQCVVVYRAKLRTEGLTEPAYLEMWCRISGRGEFFSRGLDNSVTGSNDWATYEIPFILKKGEKPDLIKLNLVFKGPGKVWVKDLQLFKTALLSK